MLTAMSSKTPNGEARSVPSPKLAQSHIDAASHLRQAGEFSELAAKKYSHGEHAMAAHYALLAHAHMQHAGTFMSDAAKVHAELHGGNRHTLIG